MPFGAMRHGYTFQPAAGGGVTVSTTAAYSLSNYTFNADTYQMPKISYAGDDSSGQPVFFVASKNSSGNHVCSLIRRNNDDTISESSVTTLKSNHERFSAQGVAGFDTSGNPVGVTVSCFRNAGVVYQDIHCNQIDLDNLTLGTTYSDTDWTALGPSAGFAYTTYAGNGRFVVGYRNGGIRTAVAVIGTSSITSISSEDLHSTNIGDGVYQGIHAFPYQNDTDYKYAYHNGNGNQQGVAFYAGATTQGEDSDDVITTGLGGTLTIPLNNTSYITVATKTGTAKATGATVSWPASGAPTQTVSSEFTFADSSTWNGSFCGTANTATSTAYILHDDSTNGWKIIPLTLSGTTITEGTDIAIESEVTTTNWSIGSEAMAACFADSTQGDLFVALIDDTSSNNPQILVRDVG
jgi:hypothetical protein